MLKFFLICMLYPVFCCGQSENSRWSKAEYSYETETLSPRRDYSIQSDNISDIIAEGFTKSYWLFISDLDGDNCPFRPSCSSFFMQSVKKTNLVRGTLMFFDRFTRDINFTDRHVHYPLTPEGYYKDPPENHIF